MSKLRRGGKNNRQNGRELPEVLAIPLPSIRAAFGVQVERIDRPFCECRLWWWRPLLDCVGPHFKENGDYRVPERNRAFFPAHVFEALQSFHAAGKMHLLLALWRFRELWARIPDAENGGRPSYDPLSSHWPAYVFADGGPPSEIATLGPLEINLGKTDDEILAEVRKEITHLRKTGVVGSNTWEDGWGKVVQPSNRNRHFNVSPFGIIEVIDKHVLLGLEKEQLEWANVRKAIKQATL